MTIKELKMSDKAILEILNEIGSQRSTKHKSSVLEANKDNELLKKVFYMTYSPLVLFGISKVDMSKKSEDSVFSEVTLKTALDLIEIEICSRNRTGHKAHTYIADIITELKDPTDAEVIRRILARDLECGASETLANKVWKGLVEKQPQNLATANSEKAMSKIKFPAIIQLKEDGARVFAEDSKGVVSLITRGSNLYTGLTKLEKELKEVFSDMWCDWVIDGELVAFKDGKRMPREYGNGLVNKSIQGTITEEEADQLKLVAWDFFPKFVYDSKELAKDVDSYKQRFDKLADMIKDKEQIVLIESQEVNSIKEANAIFLSYLAKGLEGAIIKNYNCKWVDGRNPDIVKMKLCESIDMQIIDVYAHNKDPNKLGGITVRTKCRTAVTNCGSGFTDTGYKLTKCDGIEMAEYIPLDQRGDKDREYLWSIKDELIGQIVELECGGPISSKGRDTYSLFLPIFKQFRRDKKEANNLTDVFDLSLFS